MDNKNFTVPRDIEEAIHRLITKTPGGYRFLANELEADSTENALKNRVRQVGGQIMPLGMAILLESITGRTDITEAMCKRAGGRFVKEHAVGDLDQVELLRLLISADVKKGEVDLAIDQALQDGAIDDAEAADIRAKSNKHLASREEYVGAILRLHEKR